MLTQKAQVLSDLLARGRWPDSRGPSLRQPRPDTLPHPRLSAGQTRWCCLIRAALLYLESFQVDGAAVPGHLAHVLVSISIIAKWYQAVLPRADCLLPLFPSHERGCDASAHSPFSHLYYSTISLKCQVCKVFGGRGKLVRSMHARQRELVGGVDMEKRD